MAESARIPVVSYDDYLALEASRDVKHEYWKGEVVAMAGETPEHAALSMAVGAELHAALRGRPCRVFSSDARVRIAATDLTVYPDVTVVGGALQRDPRDPLAIANPLVVVEVLSDSTEARDRGAKASHYRQCPSIAEYVLISQAEKRIEVYRRKPEGRWELLEAEAGGQVTLESLDCTLDVDSVYRDPLAS